MHELEQYLNEREKLINNLMVKIPIGVIAICISVLLITDFDSNSKLKYIHILGKSLSILGIICVIISTKVKQYYTETKWKSVFPKYDIEGDWTDVTKYTNEILTSGFKNISDKAVGIVRFKQTGSNIRIEPSPSKDLSWYSNIVEWKDDKLMIFYTVDYFETKRKIGYPHKRVGYEEMTIESYDSKTGKPNKMKGKFFHCISDDGKPMYMGDVIYTRE